MIEVKTQYEDIGRGYGRITWSFTGSSTERAARVKETYQSLAKVSKESLYLWEKDGVSYVSAEGQRVCSSSSGFGIKRGGIPLIFGDPRGMGDSDLRRRASEDLGPAGYQAHLELGSRIMQERGGDLLINGPATGL